MEEKKLNMEVAEVTEEVKPDPKRYEWGKVIEAGFAYNKAHAGFDYAICQYVDKLFDSLANTLERFNDDYWGRDTRRVVEEGETWIDDPAFAEEDSDITDHICRHVSKELWKGFVLGFVSGRAEAANYWDMGFEPYNEMEDGDNPDLLVLEYGDPDSRLGDSLGNYLEWNYGIAIRLAKHDEYIAYMKKHHPEELLPEELDQGKPEKPERPEAQDILEFAFGEKIEPVGAAKQGEEA